MAIQFSEPCWYNRAMNNQISGHYLERIKGRTFTLNIKGKDYKFCVDSFAYTSFTFADYKTGFKMFHVEKRTLEDAGEAFIEFMAGREDEYLKKVKEQQRLFGVANDGRKKHG